MCEGSETRTRTRFRLKRKKGENSLGKGIWLRASIQILLEVRWRLPRIQPERKIRLRVRDGPRPKIDQQRRGWRSKDELVAEGATELTTPSIQQVHGKAEEINPYYNKFLQGQEKAVSRKAIWYGTPVSTWRFQHLRD